MKEKIKELVEFVKNDKPLEAREAFREIATSKIASKIESFRREVAKNFFNKTK